MGRLNLDPLAQFLYILTRDEVPVGVVEGILARHVDATRAQLEVTFSNPHLEAWARETAARLVDHGPSRAR